MDTTRPLHDVFSALAGGAGGADPADVLRASGHEALPDGLVAEAVVTYADTAPIEVAEHLSAFVRAHSPVPGGDDGPQPPSWLDALSTAPTGIDPGESLDPAAADRSDDSRDSGSDDSADPGPDQGIDADLLGAGFGAGDVGPGATAADGDAPDLAAAPPETLGEHVDGLSGLDLEAPAAPDHASGADTDGHDTDDLDEDPAGLDGI